jgi:hypothetical protein
MACLNNFTFMLQLFCISAKKKIVGRTYFLDLRNAQHSKVENTVTVVACRNMLMKTTSE